MPGQAGPHDLQTGVERKVFLIEQPQSILVESESHGPVDMVCGARAKPARVRVIYDPPGAGRNRREAS